jgi:serine/threonine protein phosphatase 1
VIDDEIDARIAEVTDTIEEDNLILSFYLRHYIQTLNKPKQKSLQLKFISLSSCVSFLFLYMPNEISIIGDVHGCYHTLKSLYEKIQRINTDIFSVGDLIDRGRYSKEAVQFCIDKKIKCVRGNHEDMMMRAVENTSRYFFSMNEDVRFYFSNGGTKTLYSYTGSLSKAVVDEFRSVIRSTGHYDWIKDLPLKYEFEKVIISHAGIIDGGDDESILWNRSEPAKLDKFQVFGHTPLREVEYIPGHYINIDTACVYENKLSAVLIDTDTGNVLEIFEEEFHSEDAFQL